MFRNNLSNYISRIKEYIFFANASEGKNIIYSGGMMRSGSTLLYNIIRLVLQKKHETNLGAGWIDDIHDLSNFDNYLIKTHSLESKHIKHSSFVFYSYRDIRVCLYSYAVKFNVAPTYDFCKHQINQYYYAKRKGAILFSYESLINDTKNQIFIISKILEVEVDVDEIFSKIPQVTYAEDAVFGYDKITLLHNNHSSRTTENEFKRSLDKELLIKIEKNFKLWFKETNYSI